MIPLNYHHLFYFYTIAKTGSIARAGEELLLAQPTLSLQLKQFEAALGRRLFERRNQRLFLTEDGRIVMDFAENIFGLGRELRGVLEGQAGRRPLSVKVGVLSGTPRAFGHALVVALLEAAPGVHVALQEGDMDQLMEALRRQQLDVLLTDVGLSSGDFEGFSHRLVAKVPIGLAASPRLARRYRRIPRDLKDAPFIVPSLPSQVFRQFQDYCAERNFVPRVVAEVQDIEIARRLAVSGHGIMPLNVYSLSVNRPGGLLAPVGPKPLEGVYESVYLITRKRKWPHPLVEHLMRTFRLSGHRNRKL